MTATTTRQTTDQRRAAHAWKAIQEILEKHKPEVHDDKKVPDKRANDKIIESLPVIHRFTLPRLIQ